VKAVAPSNIREKLVTDETSQLPIGPMKFDVERNMDAKFVAWLMSHASISMANKSALSRRRADSKGGG
jgi:hypothetical protein